LVHSRQKELGNSPLTVRPSQVHLVIGMFLPMLTHPADPQRIAQESDNQAKGKNEDGVNKS